MFIKYILCISILIIRMKKCWQHEFLWIYLIICRFRLQLLASSRDQINWIFLIGEVAGYFFLICQEPIPYLCHFCFSLMIDLQVFLSFVYYHRTWKEYRMIFCIFRFYNYMLYRLRLCKFRKLPGTNIGWPALVCLPPLWIKLFYTAFSVCTKRINMNFCCSANTGVSVCSSPLEYVAMRSSQYL